MVELPIRRPLPSVPPYHPRPIWSVYSIRPIQPVASKFLQFYQPAHKKPIFPSEMKQTNTIQPIRLKSQLVNSTQESLHHL